MCACVRAHARVCVGYESLTIPCGAWYKRAMDGQKALEPVKDYIYQMVSYGAPLEKIAERIGMSRTELRRQLEMPGALRDGYLKALRERDVQIQKAFFESAVGRMADESVQKSMVYPSGDETTITETKTKYIPPNPKVLEMFLRNTEKWYSDTDSLKRQINEESVKMRKLMQKSMNWRGADGRTQDAQ